METDESNGAEFQEKPGLKRKLTGPPRLLLGKSRSPLHDGNKSRRHKRHNDDDGGNDSSLDIVKDEQSSELHKQTTPETVITRELVKGTSMDLQEECLETNLEQNMKKSWRKCKAGMTIRWIFSCGKRKRKLGMKAVEDNRIQDKDLLTHSGDSLKKKKPVKKIKVQMWRFFKKRSSTAKQEKEEEHKAGRCKNTFSEISPETSVEQRIPGAAEPPAVDEQQNESQEPKLELPEMISFNLNVNADSVFVHQNENHQHASEAHFSSLVDEKNPELLISEVELVEANSDPEDPTMCLEDPATVNAPVFKCKPLITIEEVHLPEEETDELFANTAPRYGTLSPLLSLNGSCYMLQTSDGRLPEILLAQKALSLVRAAISGAVEQLSNELQSRQMGDLDL